MMQMMMMHNRSDQSKGFDPQQMMQIQMMIQQTQQQGQMNNLLAQGHQPGTVVNPPPQNNFIPVPQTHYPPHYQGKSLALISRSLAGTVLTGGPVAGGAVEGAFSPLHLSTAETVR